MRRAAAEPPLCSHGRMRRLYGGSYSLGAHKQEAGWLLARTQEDRYSCLIALVRRSRW